MNEFPIVENLAEMSLKDIWKIGVEEGKKQQMMHDKLVTLGHDVKCGKCMYHRHNIEHNYDYCDWLGCSCNDDFFCADFEEDKR